MIAARIIADVAEWPYTSEDEDLSGCPYWARYNDLPGHDPEGICFQLGLCEPAGEPQCITCEPSGGWPLGAIRAWNAEGRP